MTTSATKTRALCVATRCTSVEQFVATFHRFCGDDQTFFVATLTSRPIGLETPFSIQLADKQPVLRGLCIVLDAWATPENRYKRPGIRLGIKRLTAESQVVFDRLKAASRSPEIPEASPPPGPPPVAPSMLPPIDPTREDLRHAGSVGLLGPRYPASPVDPTGEDPRPAGNAVGVPTPRYPASPIVASGLPALPLVGASARPPAPPRAAATPPPLPPLLGPRTGPSVRASTATPSPVLRAPAPTPPAMPVIVPPLELPRLPPEAKPPALPPLEPPPRPIEARPESASTTPGRRPTPAPIAVTRFQVALNVDARPPPIDDVEFKPTPLVPRQRIEPKVTSGPGLADRSNDLPLDSGLPAMIIDRPSAEVSLPPELAADHGAAPAAVLARAPAPELPVPDLRTPGSAFVLPANPLHDLSDESLEGFVDCTIYEESGNFFHPGIDGGDWNDEVADPPVAPRATRAVPPASVPAMPFDTPPNLTVRSHGGNESLRVAPDELPQVPPPAAEPAVTPEPAASGPFAMTATDVLFAPLHDRPESAVPWLESTSITFRQSVTAEAPPPDPAFAPAEPQSAAMTEVSHPQMYGEPTAALQPYGDPTALLQPYPTVDATQYARPTAPHAIAQSQAFVPPPPEAYAGYAPPTPRATPVWQRWLIIGGTAVIAIVVAFVCARLIRGPVGTTPAPFAAPLPRPVVAGSHPAVTAPRAAVSPPVARAPEPVAAAEPAGSAAAPAELQPEDDGEAVAGGTPIVGSGPCRFTVASTPAGSIIRIDDQAMGPSPITIDGTCDKHKVDVSHARYQSQTRWVTLVADKPQELDVSLPRPIHAVTVSSFPPGAELSIDGHRAGTTPTVVQMTGFATVNLTFTKQGFQSVTKKIYSKLPQDKVFVKLMK